MAASNGDKVVAITDSRHSTAVTRSRRQSGQLRGSLASSLGCGTRITPSLLCLTLPPVRDAPPAAASRSSSVAVPVISSLAGLAPTDDHSPDFNSDLSTHRAHVASSCRSARRVPSSRCRRGLRSRASVTGGSSPSSFSVLRCVINRDVSPHRDASRDHVHRVRTYSLGRKICRDLTKLPALRSRNLST